MVARYFTRAQLRALEARVSAGEPFGAIARELGLTSEQLAARVAASLPLWMSPLDAAQKRKNRTWERNEE